MTDAEFRDVEVAEALTELHGQIIAVVRWTREIEPDPRRTEDDAAKVEVLGALAALDRLCEVLGYELAVARKTEGEVANG
ncbi:MAG: hypothetical protein IPM35_20400 [Myxococcales bacterium]|nr:hypothetical protein [Myxococcales bacterium]